MQIDKVDVVTISNTVKDGPSRVYRMGIQDAIDMIEIAVMRGLDYKQALECLKMVVK